MKPYGISVTLALPPDTDTPGFANEEKSKPLETKLISETGGLYSPDVVGAKLLKDALVSVAYCLRLKRVYSRIRVFFLTFSEIDFCEHFLNCRRRNSSVLLVLNRILLRLFVVECHQVLRS